MSNPAVPREGPISGSRFASYSGAACYNGFARYSRYVPGFDGTLLALDYFLPTKDGALGTECLPAIFQMTPYNRAKWVDGALVHVLSPHVDNHGIHHLNNLELLCHHGYVVVVVDVRGQGASFGSYTGCMTAEEGRDGAAIIDWIAEQPWCSGAVGMLGSSYGASTQFQVAAERPMPLKALYAAHSYFDAYDVFFPGGVRELSIPDRWASLVDDLAGRTAETVVAPVDGDDAAVLLAHAITEHRAGQSARAIFATLFRDPLRDDSDFFTSRRTSGPLNLSTLLPELKRAAIPAYFHGGWNDYFPGHLAQWFVNWTTAPAKLVIGPWTHSPFTFSSPRDDEDLRVRATESLRWFDHWLKDIDTGILDEPSVHYAVQESHPYREGGFDVDFADQWTWRSSERWPLDGTETLRWYPVSAIESGSAGALARLPSGSPGIYSFIIDPAITTGSRARMGASFQGLATCYPEMSHVDARLPSWTSVPFVEAVTIAGRPLVSLCIASTASDVTIFAWLEQVDRSGRSTLLTYGNMRASHRSLGQAPYDTAGATYQLSSSSVVANAMLVDQASATLQFTLLPVANRINAGQRLRLTLSGSDAGNFEGLAAASVLSCKDGAAKEVWLDLPTLFED